MLIILLSRKKLRQILNLVGSKLMIESQLLSISIIIDSVLKINPWTSKIKDLNGFKNNRKFL